MFNAFENSANKILIDNTTTTNVTYIGVARCGADISKEEWKIIKETFDDNGNLTSSLTYKTFAKWDDRASLCY